ncbi:MAG TPA: hypothetical protein VIE43_04880 [Thermoanaerobaculia bacterium]|jgi:hypothetical protein|nr:hypothetical protein [Thermoanaerobaculia bacterium]
MPKHATAKIEDVELKRREPASAEEMEHREETAALLLALRDRPVTEDEKELARELKAAIEWDRPRFR